MLLHVFGSQPEIPDLHVKITTADENVPRLEIAMNDALLVRRFERLRDLPGKVDRLGKGDTPLFLTNPERATIPLFFFKAPRIAPCAKK